MSKTKDQIRSEISATLQSQAINSLIEALTDSQLKIAEMTQSLEELKKLQTQNNAVER